MTADNASETPSPANPEAVSGRGFWRGITFGIGFSAIAWPTAWLALKLGGMVANLLFQELFS